MTRRNECRGCLLAADCGYQYLFETRVEQPAGKGVNSHAPHPFALEITPSAETPHGAARHVVGINLLGRALNLLPMITAALARAGRGGVDGRRFLLERVEQQVNGAWRAIHPLANSVGMLPGSSHVPRSPNGPVRIDLTSPLRLIRKGRPVREGELSPRIFIHALCRRFLELNEHHGLDLPVPEPWPPIPPRQMFPESRLRWVEISRYSGRQRRKHPIGGLTGYFVLDMEGLEEAWPLLWHGQYLHVGKFISGGHGGYRICCSRVFDETRWTEALA